MEPTAAGHTANTGALNAATQPNLSSYSERTITIDAPEAPGGFDLGQGSFRVYPPYRSGYSVTAGSDYSITAIGRLLNDDGEPVSLVTGTARELAKPEKPGVTVFTNREGKFGIAGLAPGKWRIEMLDDRKSAFEIDIPKDSEGAVRLGDLTALKGSDMRIDKMFSRIVAILAAILLWSTGQAAWAQGCGVIGLASSGATSLVYDPFSPTGASTVTPISMQIMRIDPPGGARTNLINMYLSSEMIRRLNGTQIIPLSISGGAGISRTGTGQNIFYDFPGAPVLPINGSSGSGRFITIQMTSNSVDTAIVTFNVILPSSLNVNAQTNLSFRANFTCRYKAPGQPDTWGSGFRDDAIVLPVTVLSALQASYAGGALDFGEVGDKTTVDVLAAPATYTRSGNVNVRSSGPYSVTMTSDNNYKLVFSGGSLTNPSHTMVYSASFVGVTRQGVSGINTPIAAITKNCVAATLAGVSLPVSVVLQEGGQSKTPANVYNDFLNITIAPLAAATPGSSC